MGAETRICVKVLVTQEKWIEVDAVTRLDAEVAALELPGVISVLECRYPSGMDATEVGPL